MASTNPPASLAKRAEWIPGSPPRASTQRPESSAKEASVLTRHAASALIAAFSAKLAPVSSGSASPSSAADSASIP